MRPEVVAATYDILVRKAQERDVVTYSKLSSMVYRVCQSAGLQ